MMEPIEKKAINAAIDTHFSKAPFAAKPFEVNAVIPERTFLDYTLGRIGKKTFNPQDTKIGSVVIPAKSVA